MSTEKVTVESNVHGIGGKYDSIILSTIHTGLQQLKSFARQPTVNGKGYDELLWEIRLYEWLLAQPDAEEKARLYLETRMPLDKAEMKEKREVVKLLGWDIP